MLDRVVSDNKEKVQFYLDVSIIHIIRHRAAKLGKTQSKYISDLVNADIEGRASL
jgi:hypothetical protein